MARAGPIDADRCGSGLPRRGCGGGAGAGAHPGAGRQHADADPGLPAARSGAVPSRRHRPRVHAESGAARPPAAAALRDGGGLAGGARGYLVALPQRPGHGETGGPYLEDQGGCAGADHARAGLATAASIEAAIRHLTARPDVRRDGIVVLGHSAGGWGAVALTSRNPPGVAAVIGFAPGRGGRSFDRANHNCAPDRLVAAAEGFGRTARIPALWIYAENDSYFAPALARRMAAAYRGAGGRLALHLLPRFGEEGHALLAAREGVPAWGPIVAAFLANLK
ncbi:MAG: dienelactone hydrolase family protein [Xanthobacteraceae bacterium]|nr:dienelactone hydrolase family protein [Xanthobacteraceae bacterium]